MVRKERAGHVRGDARDEHVAEFPLPEHVTEFPLHFPNSEGFVYEAEAVSDAVQRGLLECPEYTLAETLGAMETMDTIRAHLGVRYACDTAGAGDR